MASSIEEMREVAELLVSQNKYREAFTIYDELYRQVWSLLGRVHKSDVASSKKIFGVLGRPNNYMHSQYIDPAVNSMCAKMYSISLVIFIDEFIRILYGHLQCICYSIEFNKEIVPENVLNEFIVFFSLISQPPNKRTIAPVLAIVKIDIDDNNRLVSIKSKYPKGVMEKVLIDNVARIRNGEWENINHLLFGYLSNMSVPNKYLIDKISFIIGARTYNSYQQFQRPSEYNKDDTFESYERYERFERYERYEKQNKAGRNSSVPVSEDEKKYYYAKLIGLKGKVTKSEIRSKYISLISMYHPDKVQHLGPELRELAEQKTKEINVAYDWLKVKYRI